MGWDGGVIGAKVDGALHLSAGRVAAVAPLLLIAIGAGSSCARARCTCARCAPA